MKSSFTGLSVTITKKGYLRGYSPAHKRLRMDHDVVWERVNGPIPEGFEIHHRDHNKLNNHISNLQLVDDVTQKRIHSGCVLIDGVWYKPCRKCGVLKSIVEFYYKVKTRNSHVTSWCKECCIKKAVENKRLRRWKSRQLIMEVV